MSLYIIYLLISPVLWILLKFVSIFNLKIRVHFSEQSQTWKVASKTITENQNGRELLLFHAASAGEFEQLKPILRRIDKKRYFVLQTFFSPTIYEKEQDSKLFDAVCYHPFDFPWSALLFLTKFQPKFYILTRHDVWPNHLYFARLFGIQTVLINANLYENSSRFWFGLRGFNRWTFRNFTHIITGSDRLKKNLVKLLKNDINISVIGDTRFDQILDRKSVNKNKHFPEEIKETKNIIFGSIIPSDYQVIFNSIEQVYPLGNESLQKQNHRLIVVPHETDEKTLIDIERYLKKTNLSFQRFSEITKTIESSVILVDVVGILADLYSVADLAYVGAGFGAGVHSVIEPAVYGCAVAFGPNIQILDEAITMHKNEIGTIVNNSDEFAEYLGILQKPEMLAKLQKDTLKFVTEHQQISHKIINKLFD